MEGVVPRRCTDIAARAFANLTASQISLPSAKAASSPPLNASPAPVVSTAFTLNAGMISALPS